MLPLNHFFLGIIAGAILYPFIGAGSFVFVISSILVDFDHYPYHARKIGTWNVLKVYKYNLTPGGVEVFAFFHTMEFLLFVYFLSFYFRPLYFVFLGLLFHDIVDFVHHPVMLKKYRSVPLMAKKFSFTYALFLTLKKSSS